MSFLSLRQVNALWVLGLALVKHLLLRPFVRRRGPRPWLERLRVESLGAVPSAAWPLFAGSSRCIGCRLCDGVGKPEDTVWLWLASAARVPADAPLGTVAAERLVALAPEIARICPARVPVESLALLIRENARMLGEG